MTRRVVVVHWHDAECRERVQRLRQLGYDAVGHWQHDRGSELTAMLAAAPPAAIAIDLGRLPAHGRAVATWLRGRKATRLVPLLFVPGDAAKTARLRQLLPDATYAAWTAMPKALAAAIARPRTSVVVPKAADYSGTPLPQKLGIKPGARLALLSAPRGFAAVLGALPADVRVVTTLTAAADVVLLFSKSLAALQSGFAAAARHLGERGALWVAWPKKASGVLTDLDDDRVRAVGLDAGLVDNKVCAVDAVWSALRFARRVAGKSGGR
jgi:hypothetical protein